MIALLRPTRGLEFSESADSVEKALASYEHTKLRTWDKPIPDSFNALVRLALETSAQEFFFVEEDVVIPEDSIPILRSLALDVAAINYPNKYDPSFISEHRFADSGEICWISLGCTLVKRRVFERIPEPWFETGKAIAREHPGRKIVLVDAAQDRAYGNQDQFFCFMAKSAGFSIGSANGILCRHLRLDSLGEPGSNKGLHNISRL